MSHIEQLATGAVQQKDGSVLVLGDAERLADFVTKHIGPDYVHFKKEARGIIVPAHQKRMIEAIPKEREALPSGAFINHHDGGGASVCFDGENSGIARSVAQIKEILGAEWGAEKFLRVFGEPCSASAAQAYAKEQAEIEQRGIANAAAKTKSAEDAYRQEVEARAANLAKQESDDLASKKREEARMATFEATFHKGDAGCNATYQAFLDTLEEPSSIGFNHAKFFGFTSDRLVEFWRTNGFVHDGNRAEFDKYVHDYAEANLSERVRKQRGDAPLSFRVQSGCQNKEGNAL